MSVASLPEAGGVTAGRDAVMQDAVVAMYRRHCVDLPVHRFVAVAGDRVAFCEHREGLVSCHVMYKHRFIVSEL